MLSVIITFLYCYADCCCIGVISVHRGKHCTVMKRSSLRKRVNLEQRKKFIGLTIERRFLSGWANQEFPKIIKNPFLSRLTGNVGATTFRQFAVSSTTTDNWEHMDSTTCLPSFVLPATTFFTHQKNKFIIMHNCHYYYFIPLNPICLAQSIKNFENNCGR